ncbi:hypothetical protein [Mucilaginibacter phyllosphaerae]|uniref:DUF4595 domain-containing protein n=1 Tax=Mucilaginibacter phyllosphaerae TaxID=1812349 RepID=A0A4Y8AKS4_9SPHI|nr:hypothetical protein [Mucilaginibacter phyllosphaerae]MBB3967845.1 hypothetical protein [Mucilaginibacter phyllosphaerae]TEW69111.1 hypothetical protein E2R65_02795 [Mucilaginibacter phyllosphaerae]GGH02916.1 hypothetical protein GCM10007352_05380 [Mucilaginibacter phyllosphaerae]
MKFFYTLLVIIFVTFAFNACKKDAPKKNIGKVYLLKKLTRGTGNDQAIDEYSYDAKNRLIATSINSGVVKYIYTYDDQNRLAKVENYSANSLYSTQNYTYASDAVNITESYYDGSTGTKKFELTGGRVSKFFNPGYNETLTYSYDAKGNVTTIFITNVVDADTWNYVYDDKNGPLSMIGAPNLHVFYLERVGAPYTNINNVVSTTQGDVKTDYVYNADGFPVSAVFTDKANNLSYTYTYEYIIK